MTATTATRPDLRWEFLETLAGVMIGCLMLAVLFAWVLVDSYQSMHLPITPLPLRIVIAMALWAAVAAALAWLRPDSSWRWGVRLALPAVMVLGFMSLNNSGGLGWQCAAFLAGAMASGCAGGWAGTRIAFSER